jgi:recombination protein RecR
MLPDRVRTLIQLLSRLPGVGEKTAQRYVLFILTTDSDYGAQMGHELLALREHIGHCSLCGNLAERGPSGEALCSICTDHKRDPHLLCVVARVQDLMAIERTGAMRGRYFVLGKLLSPLEGVHPEELPIDRLKERVTSQGVTEIILATPPSVDGEATALFLRRELAAMGITISRIASGVPHGGELEYADPITMGRALAGRQRL